MSLTTKQMYAVFLSLLLAMFAVGAQAASVLDTGTTTAITSGFTDLKDTLLALLTAAFPFIVAAGVLMASPAIVKRLIKLMSH